MSDDKVWWTTHLGCSQNLLWTFFLSLSLVGFYMVLLWITFSRFSDEVTPAQDGSTTHGSRGRVGHTPWLVSFPGETWGSWWPYQFSSFCVAPWMSARRNKIAWKPSMVGTFSRKLTYTDPNGKLGKIIIDSKVPGPGMGYCSFQEGMLMTTCQAKAVPANDRSGTCSGRLLKTGYFTIAQLLGHDVVLFCYRVAFCRFHLIFLWYLFFNFRQGCQLHFSWRIVNCASGECGAAQPLATLGFKSARERWIPMKKHQPPAEHEQIRVTCCDRKKPRGVKDLRFQLKSVNTSLVAKKQVQSLDIKFSEFNVNSPFVMIRSFIHPILEAHLFCYIFLL